jgi:hypothetical protein
VIPMRNTMTYEIISHNFGSFYEGDVPEKDAFYDHLVEEIEPSHP